MEQRLGLKITLGLTLGRIFCLDHTLGKELGLTLDITLGQALGLTLDITLGQA